MFPFFVKGQTVTIPTGSFIVNMGVVPQTVGNGLRPYGMIYELIKDYGVTVYWSIEPSKAKDGIDFSHNGVDYRGGTFIIPAEFRTPAVNARIAHWQGLGVVGATSVSPVTVPYYTAYNLQTVPRWTLDKANGSIAAGYFVNAGIPPSAHGGSSSTNWKNPADLNCCDDLFVMPHADPVWATHQNLLFWNDTCKGGIWAACHAVSALENMVNPSSRSVQSNFLTQKDPAWTGTSGAYTLSNALVLWGSHGNGSPPYTYRLHGDPVAQFMGVLDGATTNGSEQIYLPRQGIVATPTTYSASAVARWNPGANIIVYDPTQLNVTNPNLTDYRNVAAAMVYGRGFDDPNRGLVMYEAGHSHNRATGPENIAAQRAFFNFGFLVANDKGFKPDISGLPSVITTGVPTVLSYTVTPPNTYTTQWSSGCGGSFSPNNSTSSNPTTFTPPVVTQPTPCNISITISDLCGRQVNVSKVIIIEPCVLTFNNTITPVTCNGQSNGSISMSITGSPGPYSWNWSRVSPAGTGMGTGTSISGLSAGTYNVTVTAPGSCSGTFTAVVAQPNPLTVTPSVTNYACFGGTGTINLTVTGGNPGYTYAWSGSGSGSNPRTGLLAGSYTVTVTDTKGCTATATATVTGPLTALSLSSTKTNVSCNGGSNGSINLSVSGGTPGYTYAWSGAGSGTNPRTNLAAGTYIVTVTDANGCTTTLTETITQPPILTISLTKNNPTCPPAGNPPVNADGSIVVTATGGTPQYDVSWSGPLSGNPAGKEITTSGGNYTISNLVAGTYTVTVTDNNGCTASGSITLNPVNVLPPAPPSINNN